MAHLGAFPPAAHSPLTQLFQRAADGSGLLQEPSLRKKSPATTWMTGCE